MTWDNIRPIRFEDRRLAAAAIAFGRSIEDGTVADSVVVAPTFAYPIPCYQEQDFPSWNR